MAPGSYKRVSNCKESCLPPKKNLQCYFCCSAHDPFGLLFPCRVFSLSQGAQVHDFQFVEDSQLDFGCRVGCCCHLFSCQPTVDSADAAGQAERDCVRQPAVDSADAAGQSKRDCVCQSAVDSADAAGQSKRDCVCQPAVDSADAAGKSK